QHRRMLERRLRIAAVVVRVQVAAGCSGQCAEREGAGHCLHCQNSSGIGRAEDRGWAGWALPVGWDCGAGAAGHSGWGERDDDVCPGLADRHRQAEAGTGCRDRATGSAAGSSQVDCRSPVVRVRRRRISIRPWACGSAGCRAGRRHADVVRRRTIRLVQAREVADLAGVRIREHVMIQVNGLIACRNDHRYAVLVCVVERLVDDRVVAGVRALLERAAVAALLRCRVWMLVPVAHTAPYSSVRRSSCAFNATMTVLSDISTAPTAGCSRIPLPARMPAASGIAMTL